MVQVTFVAVTDTVPAPASGVACVKRMPSAAATETVAPAIAAAP